MTTKSSSVLSVLAAIFGIVALAGGQESTTVLADARQKFEAGEYRPALQLIATELSRGASTNSREATPSPQRYDLLMLRGECLLRIDQRASAADSFTQAERSASTPQEYGLAHANSMLVKASPNNKFPARGGSGDLLDVLDPESRKRAFAGMQEQRLCVLKPKLDRAMTATTLPPMFEVLQPLLDIAALEFAANGNAIDTRVTLMDLGTRARGLISDELKRINVRLNALEDASNSVVGGTVGFVSRRGLYSNEAAEVRQAVDYLGQIEKTARDVRQRAQKLGFTAEAWEPIIADTSDLIDRAQAMLNIVP